jgi:hypothetical protein
VPALAANTPKRRALRFKINTHSASAKKESAPGLLQKIEMRRSGYFWVTLKSNEGYVLLAL